MTSYSYKSENSDLDWIVTIVEDWYELRLVSDLEKDPYISDKSTIENILKKTIPRYSNIIRQQGGADCGRVDFITLLISRSGKSITNRWLFDTHTNIDEIEKFIISFHRNQKINQICDRNND